MNRKQSDFDVTELSVQQSECFFRRHVFPELLVLELVVAVIELLLVGKVDQSDVNGKLVDVIMVLKNILNTVLLNLSLGVLIHLSRVVLNELLDLVQGL